VHTNTQTGDDLIENQQNAVFARHKQFSSARMVFSECSFTDNCVSSNAMPDVDVGATGHRAMKPNVFSFKNVTIKQGADRDWLSTTGDGTVLKGFPTLFRGAVEIVDGRGSSRTETLDDAWMERRFKWVPSDEPPVPPRTPPRFRNTKVVDAEPWKMSPLQEVFVCNARFSAAYAFFAPDSGSVTFEVKRHLRKRKSFGTTALQIFDYETGKRVALAVIPDSSLCRVRFDVPKRGFYRFDAPGRRTPFAITAANVPLAIDLTKGVCPFVGCEKDLYFHVSGYRRFACSVNGDGREGLKMELFDPSDSSVWSRSLTGDLGDFFVSETVPASGMWRIRVSRAADIFFEDHSIGLSGIDAFLFLSRDRCWYSDSKD
jgi:hypothetical protein